LSYRESYPENIMKIEGEGRGRYEVTQSFVPKIAKLSIDLYFHLTAQTNTNIQIEYVRQDFTFVDPKKIRVLHNAVNNGTAVNMTYRSMNHPKGLKRTIHPCVFVFAGRRWHVRGFDELTREFRDFNLSRISQIEASNKKVKTPIDLDWEELVDLMLKPHPSLTNDQEQLIRDEFFEGAAIKRVTTRRALINYTLRELEVAKNIKLQRPPEFQLYLYRSQKAK
jgi:predicted DNA-binding transcriptional regulator YafY